LIGQIVTANYFDVLGVKAAVGRTFVPEDDLVPGAQAVVVISHSFWMRRFAGSPAAIGATVRLNNHRYTIVGVAPRGFRGPNALVNTDFWVPFMMYEQVFPLADWVNQRGALLFAVIGRLKPGIRPRQAEDDMRTLAAQLAREYPVDNKDRTVKLLPVTESMIQPDSRGGFVMVGAVALGAGALVLLIACANVANLLLARAAGRQREIAIRTAIGANRWHLIRQLLTESLLLSGLGGMLGFLIGAWSVPLLLALSPGNLPRVNDPDHLASAVSTFNWPVLAFTLAVALATGVLFGLFPALQISKLDVNANLKEASGRSGTGLRHNRARGVLVAAEMALAVILLAGAVLMIRTFVGLRSAQPGFDARNVLTMQTSLTGGRYDTTGKAENLIRQVTQRIEALPGVQGAACTVMLPVEGGVDLPFSIEGQPPPKGDLYSGDQQWRFVGAHYFSALRVPMLRGRSFDERDTGKSEHVVIINQAFARKYWPKGDPVGQRITIGKGLGPQFEEPAREIVGIAGNIRETGLQGVDEPVMYVPESQVTDGLTQLANSVLPLGWVIRSSSDPAALSSAVQAEFRAVDSMVPVSKVRTMEQVISESTARQSFNMLLLAIFAGLALLLAAIGIYGLMSYTVEQRRQEIGIRMALGAGRGDMLKLIVRHGMILAATGVVIGLAAAFGLTRVLASLLFGVKTTDPLTYASVGAILLVVALVASYIPARRATEIDPLIALRYE
ncbi:MAG TPA: ABC transporter permease, partial [Bryobacteraceae bacterium]|nr:ABC transporter permease [Bryobacteraceae bacterium]